MKERMNELRAASIQAILEADNTELLENLRVKYLGKKGELTGILRQMGKLSAEERPVMGQLANQLRSEIETAIANWNAEYDRLAAIEYGEGYVPEINDANAASADRFAKDCDACLTQTRVLAAINRLIDDDASVIGWR